MSVIQRYAWIFLFGIGLLLALFSVYIIVAGVDSNDFQSSTGIAWSEMQASQPEVSRYLNRLERLLGAATLGFGFLGAMVAWMGFRNREKWAWYAMWSFPLVFALIAVIFVLHESPGLASYYGVISILTGLGIVLAVRRFF